MKESAYKMLVLAVSIIFGIMLIAGCEEEEKISDTMTDEPPDAKRSRLIAVENAQLKARIARMKDSHTREMESQKNLHDKERQRQQRKLDSCLRAQAVSEEISEKGVENYMQNILGPVVDENAKLKEEIETLKAQIEKLKKELEDLKNPKVVPL